MTTQRAELLTSIYNRYLHALRSTEHLSLDVVQFALTLAIQDVAAALEIISKQDQPSSAAEDQQMLLDIASTLKRLTPTLFERHGWDFTRLLEAVFAEHLADVAAKNFLISQADRLRIELDAAIAERDALSAIMLRIERIVETHDSTLYADFADDKIDLPAAIQGVLANYRAALVSAERHIMRLKNPVVTFTSEWTGDDGAIHATTFDAIVQMQNTHSIPAALPTGNDTKGYPTAILTAAEAAAQTANGKTRTVAEMLAVVDAEQTADGNVSVWTQPGMLDFLDAETRDYWDGITAGRWTWRKLPKRTRLAMVRHVLSFGPDPGDMTQAQFDAMKPSWMPPGSSHPGSFGVSWSQLNDARVEVTV